jgi:glycosyltransferase involved in cell wall biosynthesis
VSHSRLTVVRHGLHVPAAGPGETVMSTDALRGWIRSGRMLGRIGGWHEARLLTDRVETLGRPLPTALVLRLLSRGDCYAEDAAGRRRPLSLVLLARWATALALEPLGKRSFLAAVERRVTALEAASSAGPHVCTLDLAGAPVYVRADVSFGLKAGGSVSHTAGVANHLGDLAGPPIILTTGRVPTLADGIEAHDIVPDEAFWNFRELPAFGLNAAVVRTAARAIGARGVAFVYQRYTLNGFGAIEVARTHRVPLVTEYNGSEVWVARHWGRPLTYESLSARIERLNLRAAHLVTVVSRPLAREAEAAGVAPERVLVNPNGVDTDAYRPDLDGSRVRARYGLGDALVIGFIGTFGPWHGAEVLAEAFVRLLAARPRDRERLRLLWIGDGASLPRVREIVLSGGVADRCVFTGLVPQSEGAEHLAACDILASPHVPNPDGTPFFGSPTKLFEYMAMGRAIVASDLDQVGEILEHGRAGQMVEPGSVDSLVRGLAALVDDPARRAALGAEARRLAVERHTWREHTARIVRALGQVVPAAA